MPVGQAYVLWRSAVIPEKFIVGEGPPLPSFSYNDDGGDDDSVRTVRIHTIVIITIIIGICSAPIYIAYKTL